MSLLACSNCKGQDSSQGELTGFCIWMWGVGFEEAGVPEMHPSFPGRPQGLLEGCEGAASGRGWVPALEGRAATPSVGSCGHSLPDPDAVLQAQGDEGSPPSNTHARTRAHSQTHTLSAHHTHVHTLPSCLPEARAPSRAVDVPWPCWHAPSCLGSHHRLPSPSPHALSWAGRQPGGHKEAGPLSLTCKPPVHWFSFRGLLILLPSRMPVRRVGQDPSHLCISEPRISRALVVTPFPCPRRPQFCPLLAPRHRTGGSA